MNFWKNNKGNILSLLFVETVILIYFWKALTLQGIFFSGDIRTVWIPLRLFIKDCIFNGQSFLWNPYILAGYPFISDCYTSGMYNPLTYFFILLFPPHAAVNYYIIFHYLIAGLSMYCYARTIRLSYPGAIAASLIFALGGFMTMRLSHTSPMDIVAPAPFVLLLIEKTYLKQKWYYCGWAGIMAGYLMVVGHPQFALYTFLLGFLYILVKPILNKDSCLTLSQFIRLTSYSILFGCIVQIVIWPTKELISYSYRFQGTPWETMIWGSLPWTHIIRFIFPFYFGRPYDYFYNDLNFIETCAYLGILPLLLIIFLLFQKNRNRYTWFYLILFIISIILALGKHTPVYLIFKYIPFLKFTRNPGRFLVLFSISGAILVGIFLDQLRTIEFSLKTKDIGFKIIRLCFITGSIVILFALMDTIPDFSLYSITTRDNFFRLIILCGSLLLLGTWLKGHISPNLFIKLFFIILLIDLFQFGIILELDANKPFPLSSYYRTPQAAIFLKKDTDHFRIYTLTNKLWDDPEDIDSQYATLYRNLSMLYNIENFQCYCAGGVWRFYQLMGILEEAYYNVPEASQLNALPEKLHILRKANIKYILTFENLTTEGLTKVSSADGASIYQISNPYPRFYFTTDWINAANPELAFSLMTDRRSAEKTIVEKSPYIPSNTSSVTYFSNISVYQYAHTQIDLQLKTTHSGFLVISDYNYPGWSAFIDSKPATIYQANYLFRGLYLSAGTHHIQMQFRARFLFFSLVFALISIVLFLILIYRYQSI